MKEGTQRYAVLSYLRQHKTLTSIEAFELFGATRLAAIVFDLRQMGYDIDTLEMETINRFGEPTRYAKYVFKGEPVK